MNKKLMFKPNLFEDDVLKALHIDKKELMALVYKGEFPRYSMFGKYEYIFTDIYNYSKRKEKEDHGKKNK